LFLEWLLQDSLSLEFFEYQTFYTQSIHGQLREALSGVWINANGSGSKAVEEGQ